METTIMYLEIILALLSAPICCYLLKKIPEDLLIALKKDNQEVINYQMPTVTNKLYSLTSITCLILTFSLILYIKPQDIYQSILLIFFLSTITLLAMIDIRTRLLPDKVVYTLLWTGLLSSNLNIFCTPTQSIYGAAILYLLFWFTDKISCLILKKRNNIGNGDMKMAAALGAWFGANAAINLLVIIAIISLIFAMIYLCLKKLKIYNDQYIPYGTILALSGFIYCLTY